MLSRRIANSEPELPALIRDVLTLADGEEVPWAVDLNAGGAALPITLLLGHGRHLLYPPDRTVHHASGAYRGDGKTDAKDTFVLADQARMRRDLQPLQEWEESAVDLRILTARRHVPTSPSLRPGGNPSPHPHHQPAAHPTVGLLSALERAFDHSTSIAALTLLTGYQAPAALRRIDQSRLATWLKNRKVRNADAVAATALEAAHAQHTAVPGERTAAAMVRILAKELLALGEEVERTDTLIVARFREHRHAEVITGMPGIGILLGAEFLACTGGDLDAFGISGRLAGVAGPAPVPKDFGRIGGDLRRPRMPGRRP